MRNIIYLVSMSLLFIVSCTTLKPYNRVSTNKEMLTKEWLLQNDDEGTSMGLANQPISLSFINENGKDMIYGFAGCNNFRSTYDALNGYISFSGIMRTKLACPQLETEDQYLSLLEKVNRYEIKGKNLYLYKGNLLLLHFKQK